MKYIEYLSEFNVISVLFRLILSMGIGAMIGVDRSRKGSPAGLKTHSLVCIGSALVMLTSEYCYVTYGIGDITRMPAQVISGIGFLGAGTIIVTGKNQIKGLTSAAGIWFSACVGLTIGIGFYAGAIVAAFLEIFVLKILSKTKFRHAEKSIYEVYLEYDQTLKLGQIIKYIKSVGGEIITVDNSKFQVFENNNLGLQYAVLTLQLMKNTTIESVLDVLEESTGVLQASDI